MRLTQFIRGGIGFVRWLRKWRKSVLTERKLLQPDEFERKVVSYRPPKLKISSWEPNSGYLCYTFQFRVFDPIAGRDVVYHCTVETRPAKPLSDGSTFKKLLEGAESHGEFWLSTTVLNPAQVIAA